MTIEQILSGETAREEFKARMIQKAIRLDIENCFKNQNERFTEQIIRFVTDLPEGNFYVNGCNFKLEENDMKEVISCLKEHCKTEVERYKKFMSNVFEENKQPSEKKDKAVELEVNIAATPTPELATPTVQPQPSYFGY